MRIELCSNCIPAIDKFCTKELIMLSIAFLQPRYVVNRVTAGDYDCPRKVLKFLTDLHAAFRMLNLRNDFLRKKFDGSYSFYPSCRFSPSPPPPSSSVHVLEPRSSILYSMNLVHEFLAHFSQV